ncbi:MAG: hypothetical protein IKU60_00295 [Clostridia bacterium]|nr:hypothetical protein [Clostridia bacterium]
MVEKMKSAMEPLYTDVCTVYETRPVDIDGRTGFEKVCRYKNIPCRISSKAYLFGENAANAKENLLNVSKKTKIFLPAEYEILPGSIVEVTSRGRKKIFAKSGEMSFYKSHNEVMVEVMKNYA